MKARDTTVYPPECSVGSVGCWRLLSVVQHLGLPSLATRCGQLLLQLFSTSLWTLPHVLPRGFEKSPKSPSLVYCMCLHILAYLHPTMACHHLCPGLWTQELWCVLLVTLCDSCWRLWGLRVLHGSSHSICGWVRVQL